MPLYRERYRLLTSADAPLGNRDSVTWAEVAQVPLCLLTPDMQNRRIIDRLLESAGSEARPTLESDSMILLYSHVRTGRWASVMPAQLADDAGPHRYAFAPSRSPSRKPCRPSASSCRRANR